MTVQFCDPPRRGQTGDLPWGEIDTILRGRPGERARIDFYPSASPASTTVNRIKKGRTGLDPEDFEARSARFIAEATATSSAPVVRFGVWVRYIGPAESVDGIPEATDG